MVGLFLVGAALVGLAGCAAENRLGLDITLSRAPYTFADERLEFWAASPSGAKQGLPVVIFLEGDGAECQAFSEGLWSRFLIRQTGSFVLVRPRTQVSSLCDRDRDRWARLDFFHRVGELEGLVPEVRRAFPTGPLVLLGHSAGAHVARLYAERHPTAVAGLINLSGGYDELSGVFDDLAAGDPSRGADLSLFVREVDGSSPGRLLGGRTARFWSQMLHSGVRPLWSAYRGPCLVLHGQDDRAQVPWAGVRHDADEVARSGGSCELETLEGLGHDTLKPEVFSRIDAWLEGLPDRTQPSAREALRRRILLGRCGQEHLPKGWRDQPSGPSRGADIGGSSADTLAAMDRP